MTDISIPNYARTALNALEAAGHEAWFVGGCVRDALLGSPVHDYDIATSALWEETEQVLLSCGIAVHRTGTKHGTVTASVDGKPIEITTYRTDGTYIFGTNTLIDTAQPVTLARQGTVDLHIDSLPVANGSYTVDLALHRPDGFNYDFWKEVCTLSVSDRKQTPGVIYLPHSWNLCPKEADR